MAADRDFYINIYGGVEYDDLSRLLLRAGNVIDSVILTEPDGETQEGTYNFAVCAQAEYIGLCGGVEAWAMSVSGTAQSFTLGSFSMSSGGSSSGGGSAAARGICSRAESYLERAGLLYRGCGVCC